MPSITITLNVEAHRRLKQRKQGRDSYSDVILRELPPVCDTGEELIKSLNYSPKLKRAKRRAA